MVQLSTATRTAAIPTGVFLGIYSGDLVFESQRRHLAKPFCLITFLPLFADMWPLLVS
jgi:hypothetical protein